MKVDLVEETVPKFNPVTVTITFESEDEIIDLWHRLNMSSTDVGSSYEEGNKKRVSEFYRNLKGRSINPLWYRIDNFIDEKGIETGYEF